MKTEHIYSNGKGYRKLERYYSNLEGVSDFLKEVKRNFMLEFEHNAADATNMIFQIPHLEILKKEVPKRSNGLYIACNVPLGPLLMKAEGYKILGIDIDHKAMDFGVTEGITCVTGDCCNLERYFSQNKFDFTVSRNFKRRDYLSDDRIIQILNGEYNLLRSGGVSISSTYVGEYYLQEKMEKLYEQTPFEDITRYLIYTDHSDRYLAAVVDVLKKH